MILAADQRHVGSVLSGAADGALAAADLNVATLLTVPVADDDAVRSGLACGGTAQLLVQPLGSVPALAWQLIERREPFVLATDLSGPSLGCSTVVRSHAGSKFEGSGHAGGAESVEAAIAHITNGKTRTAVVESPVGPVHLETVSPQPRAVVIGSVALAGAIERQGGFLGWESETVDERVEGGLSRSSALAAGLGPVDALIVLSHDLPASCAALAAALRGRCGYVGALGSRHTQSARRERLLTIENLTVEQADRIHGPIGLNLGSRTPEETALAIFAEILATRRGLSASSLSASNAPIHG